jgi:hypothetical protein
MWHAFDGDVAVDWALTQISPFLLNAKLGTYLEGLHKDAFCINATNKTVFIVYVNGLRAVNRRNEKAAA